MSYILDALRRADSERERGGVPGIHAQPVPITSEQRDRSARIAPWMWGGFGVAALLLGAYAWHALQRPADAPEPLAPVAAERAAPTPAANVPAPAPTVAAAVPAPLAPAPPPPARVAVVAPTAPPITAPVPRSAAPAPAPAQATASAAAPASSASAADTRVYAVNELPDAIQRQLPKLTIGGSIYSDNAASRFLIINGQVFHESDRILPELTLEQIKLKTAVLRYKGYRYGITY